MNIGDKAPEILGKDENGKEIRLSDFQGRKLILYFYPKDNTSGCTAEACSLRDHHQELQQAGFEIVGVSKDSAASHVKFKEKYELPFPLIADIDHHHQRVRHHRADLCWQTSQNQRTRRADSGESLNHVFVPSANPTNKSRNIWQFRDFCLFLQANFYISEPFLKEESDSTHNVWERVQDDLYLHDLNQLYKYRN